MNPQTIASRANIFAFLTSIFLGLEYTGMFGIPFWRFFMLPIPITILAIYGIKNKGDYRTYGIIALVLAIILTGLRVYSLVLNPSLIYTP